MVHSVAEICGTVRPGTRQDIVHIGRVADTFDGFSFFGESRLLVQVVTLAMQVCYVLRDKFNQEWRDDS